MKSTCECICVCAYSIWLPVLFINVVCFNGQNFTDFWKAIELNNICTSLHFTSLQFIGSANKNFTQTHTHLLTNTYIYFYTNTYIYIQAHINFHCRSCSVTANRAYDEWLYKQRPADIYAYYKLRAVKANYNHNKNNNIQHDKYVRLHCTLAVERSLRRMSVKLMKLHAISILRLSSGNAARSSQY